MGAFKNFRRKHKLNRSAITARLRNVLLFAVPKRWRLYWEYVQRYQLVHKEFFLLLKPQTFNQKIFYKMLYDRRPLLATFADKLQAREYVRQKIGSDILVPLLAVADRPEELRFEQFPSKFVLKANHGSGYVRVVRDKSQEDETALRRICQEWLAKNYGEISGEWIYDNIPPKIMVESYLASANGEVACDYKFFVFNGTAFMIEVDVDRYLGHRRNLYSAEWKMFDVRYRVPNTTEEIPKPATLEKMLKIAERLGEDTDFVRVDLYDVDGQIYFGELTNFPTGGIVEFEPKSFGAVLGAQWRIEGY